jgi:hypothetical protein
VVFATFIEEIIPIIAFLGLVRKIDVQIIYDCLLKLIEECRLDMQKCVGLGFDGAATMLGQKLGVATKLKKVNPCVILFIGPTWQL